MPDVPGIHELSSPLPGKPLLLPKRRMRIIPAGHQNRPKRQPPPRHVLNKRRRDQQSSHHPVIHTGALSTARRHDLAVPRETGRRDFPQGGWAVRLPRHPVGNRQTPSAVRHKHRRFITLPKHPLKVSNSRLRNVRRPGRLRRPPIPAIPSPPLCPVILFSHPTTRHKQHTSHPTTLPESAPHPSTTITPTSRREAPRPQPGTGTLATPPQTHATPSPPAATTPAPVQPGTPRTTAHALA